MEGLQFLRLLSLGLVVLGMGGVVFFLIGGSQPDFWLGLLSLLAALAVFRRVRIIERRRAPTSEA